MKIKEAKTGAQIQFNKYDSVACIGCVVNEELTRKALKKAGTTDITLIPSLTKFKEEQKEKAAEELLKYDYHIVIGKSDPSMYEFCEKYTESHESDRSGKSLLIKDNIRLMDALDGVIYRIKDGKVSGVELVRFSPSIMEKHMIHA